MILKSFKWHVKNSNDSKSKWNSTYLHKTDAVSSLKQELIFAILQALASMEEHVSMHWTRLFVTVRCDIQENIVEVREYLYNLLLFL